MSVDIKAQGYAVQPVRTQSDVGTMLSNTTLESFRSSYNQPLAINRENDQWEIKRLV